MRPFLFTTFEKELKTDATINSALISAMSIGLAISALLSGGISDRSVLTCSILLCSGLTEQSATQDRKTTYVPCWLLGNPCFWDALCSFAVLAGNIELNWRIRRRDRQFDSRVLGAGKTVGKNTMRSALTQHENLNSCCLFWRFRF